MSTFGFSEDGVRRIIANVRRGEHTPTIGKTRYPQPIQSDKEQWHPFRNNSGTTIPAFGVMMQTGTEQTSSYVRRTMTMEKPGAQYQPIWWVNSSMPVPDGECGLCSLHLNGGLVYCTGTFQAGDIAGVHFDSWQLLPDKPGFFVIGDPDDSLPEDVLYVVQRPPAGLWGTLDSALTSGSTGTVSLTDFTAMELTGVSGARITESGWQIPTGASVYVELDTLQIVNARECPVEV